MPNLLRIDPESHVPIWRQIVDGVSAAVARGEYRPGEHVPSVRQLALDLRVNPNTVARAFRELDSAGVLSATRGRGMTVSSTRSVRNADRASREEIARRIERVVKLGLAAGLAPSDLRALLSDALAEVSQGARSR